MPYGAPWRARRRLCHEALNVRLTDSFDGHQYKYVHRLLSRLLEEPKRFIEELDLYVASYRSHLHPKRHLMHRLTPKAHLEPLYCP